MATLLNLSINHKPPLSIWYDNRLPNRCIDAVKNLKLPVNLRNLDGVATLRINAMDIVACDGHVAYHSDWNSISLLWILRNDLNSYVATKRKKVKKQPVGTLILLDIDKEHALIQPGDQNIHGVWAAVEVDDYSEWPSEEEIECSINTFLIDRKDYESTRYA